MHLVVFVLLLFVLCTREGRWLAVRLLGFVLVAGIVIVLLFKFMAWWLYAPSSPGYDQHAVDTVREMMRVDEKRKECDRIAVINWDEECRRLFMGN